MKYWKQKLKYGVAVVTTTALPAIAMANESDLLGVAKTELTALKAGVLALGGVAVGIGIAFAMIRVGKRGSNAVG